MSEASTNNSKTSGSSAGASSSNNKPKKKYAWGVRTLDFIPENAFVCEVTGQYAYGRSGTMRMKIHELYDFRFMLWVILIMLCAMFM